jgi:hypothetical protein
MILIFMLGYIGMGIIVDGLAIYHEWFDNIDFFDNHFYGDVSPQIFTIFLWWITLILAFLTEFPIFIKSMKDDEGGKHE